MLTAISKMVLVGEEDKKSKMVIYCKVVGANEGSWRQPFIGKCLMFLWYIDLLTDQKEARH